MGLMLCVISSTGAQAHPSLREFVKENTTITQSRGNLSIEFVNAIRHATRQWRKIDARYQPSCVIPCYVIECESHGDYAAENPYSSASGRYQIVDATWDGYGGYSHASDAPPATQDQRAAQLWDNGAGAWRWSSCM